MKPKISAYSAFTSCQTLWQQIRNDCFLGVSDQSFYLISYNNILNSLIFSFYTFLELLQRLNYRNTNNRMRFLQHCFIYYNILMFYTLYSVPLQLFIHTYYYNYTAAANEHYYSAVHTGHGNIEKHNKNAYHSSRSLFLQHEDLLEWNVDAYLVPSI